MATEPATELYAIWSGSVRGAVERIYAQGWSDKVVTLLPAGEDYWTLVRLTAAEVLEFSKLNSRAVIVPKPQE